MRSFLWDEYADWYIEVSKRRIAGGDPIAAAQARRTLVYLALPTLTLPLLTLTLTLALPTLTLTLLTLTLLTLALTRRVLAMRHGALGAAHEDTHRSAMDVYSRRRQSVIKNP